MNENVLEKNMYDLSKVSDVIQTILIFLIALLVPTFVPSLLKTIFGAQSIIGVNSQLIVGSIVNIALITAAINVKGWKKIAGIVTMPSISTILSGYVFGTASVYMVYMIPAIWLGNFAIVYLFKLLLLKEHKNYLLAGMLSVLAKVGVIFLGFNILKAVGIFPEKLVSTLQVAMSSTQLITATIGMVASFGIYKAIQMKSKKEESNGL